MLDIIKLRMCFISLKKSSLQPIKLRHHHLNKLKFREVTYQSHKLLKDRARIQNYL